MTAPVGIFAATRWELRAVLQAMASYETRSMGGWRYWYGRRHGITCLIFKTGIGPRKAATLSRAVIQALPLSAAVSTGFACALNDAQVGDVLIGTEILGDPIPSARSALPCDEEWTKAAMRAVSEAGLPNWTGRFISMPRILCQGREKEAIAKDSGAIGADMESAALAMAAADAGIPFALVRTVSDRKNENLPLDFNLFLRPTDWMAGAMACLSHPAGIVGLSRLRTQSRIACERLTRFFASYLTALPAVTQA